MQKVNYKKHVSGFPKDIEELYVGAFRADSNIENVCKLLDAENKWALIIGETESYILLFLNGAHSRSDIDMQFDMKTVVFGEYKNTKSRILTGVDESNEADSKELDTIIDSVFGKVKEKMSA